MSVLATIATANAAYSVIKTCLANGSEINGIIGQVSKFLSAEDDLKEAVKRKKSSPIAAITGSSEGDWEAFQALEDLKEKRRELESWCRLYAPSGTWDRWQFFQAEARKARRAAEKQKEKEREEMMDAIMTTFAGLIALGGGGAVIYFIGRHIGKW
tara:strand:- start:381 stop:848 length:468 start_codon:yes stop_codon:yes gene_type:complete